MVDIDRKVSLEIKDITIEEAKQVMMLIREFDKKDRKRLIFSRIRGLEELNSLEAGQILTYVFPHLKRSS